MSTIRRLRRVTTTKLALFVLVYSAVVCETSSIFDFFKRSSSSSSSSPVGGGPGGSGMSSPGSGSNDINTHAQVGDGSFQNSHHFHSSVSRSSPESNHINPSHPDPTVSSYETSSSDQSHDDGHGHNGEDHGHSYVKDAIARGNSGWGGWGWGGHGQDSNLDLYSLLGGLSFASLLGATIVYLARRSSTNTVVMNATGRRRRRSLDDMDDDNDLVGESLPEFLAKLGIHLENPWWKKRDDDNKFVVPFKLNNNHR